MEKMPKRDAAIEITGPAFGLFPLPSFTAFAVLIEFITIVADAASIRVDAAAPATSLFHHQAQRAFGRH